MSESIAGLFSEFFDNKMENFETAFPAKIVKINNDDTVDIEPSIKNCLKNMQLEPLKNGSLCTIYNVPILWAGTETAIIKYELKTGDPVFCIASSRDLRTWAEGGWNSKAAYDPLSFSGNDLNDLVAIPMRRTKHNNAETIELALKRDGTIEAKCEEFKLNAKNLKLTGDLLVDGEVTAQCKTNHISLSTHIHPTGVAPTSAPTPNT